MDSVKLYWKIKLLHYNRYTSNKTHEVCWNITQNMRERKYTGNIAVYVTLRH